MNQLQPLDIERPSGQTALPFPARLRLAVAIAWEMFGNKVGGGLLPINKEASMQLQFAYLLLQLLPLHLHSADERAEVELETGVRTASGHNNIDVLVKGESKDGPCRIAIEMKCYRNVTASGGTRGAHDIFMKDIYEDLQVLEEYVDAGLATHGIALVMTDLPRFPFPRSKAGACWAYDSSHGHSYLGGVIDIPIGGKAVRVVLRRSYAFAWVRRGDFWFMCVEGALVTPDAVV